jgi:hypothetical protein
MAFVSLLFSLYAVSSLLGNKSDDAIIEVMQAGIGLAASYFITLAVLAVFRPFILKIYSQLLQMKPDWFRLNYQWKKSRF